MKYFKYLKAFTFLTVGFTNLLFAQEYTPFILDDADWFVEEVTPMWGGKFIKYYTTSDTIIEGITYKNVSQKTVCIYTQDRDNGGINYSDSFDSNDRHIGSLREENKKVFFVNAANDKETLIYDFDVNVGDTIYYGNKYTYIIEDLGIKNGFRTYSIENSGAYTPQFPGELIEGIGNSYGLFGSRNPSLKYLECFRQKGEELYGECEHCEGFTTNNTNLIESEVSIIPNPANDYISIKSQSASHVTIYDTNGKIYLEMPISKNDKLNISELTEGNYFVKISNATGQVITKQIVKVK